MKKNFRHQYLLSDFSETLKTHSFKGTSVNKVLAHVQEVAENGGDMKHFPYVHATLFPFTNLIKMEWEARWARGDDPELMTKMKHEIPWVNERKKKLINKYITPENRKYIGVMYLNLKVVLPFCKPIFMFNGTIFQLGPGVVYLFLISPYYEVLFFEHMDTHNKFDHDVYHELYVNGWYLPYFVTAGMLRGEALQVANDTEIWNNKTYTNKPNYSLSSDADSTIFEWRKWFTQFYEGCAKKEAEREKYTW